MSSISLIFQRNMAKTYDSVNYRNNSKMSNSVTNTYTCNNNASYGLSLMYTPTYGSDNVYYNADTSGYTGRGGNVVYVNNLPDSFVKTH